MGKKHIIISETFLNELSIKKNPMASPSAVSTVYLGDKWVKKFKNKNIKTGRSYSKEELLQYKIMEENPDVFPITKVKQSKTGETIILQKKVNIERQQGIYIAIAEKLQGFNFKDFLEKIANRGMSNDPLYLQFIKETGENLGERLCLYFEQYIYLAVRLHELRQKYKIEYSADLHSQNFGLDGEKIKIIDFLSPYLKI